MTRPIPFSAFVWGFLRLVRVPNLLIVVLTQYLARLFLVGPRPESTPVDWLRLIREPDLFILSLSTVCIAAAGYIINDYFDVKIDIVNKPERVVIGRFLKRRVAITAHQVLNGLGCLLGLYLSRWVLLIDIVSLSLLWYYSANLKRLPLIGNVVISLLTALSLLVLAVYYHQHESLLLVYAAFSFGMTLIREIVKDMEDIRGDARFGRQTLPIIWGIRRTKLVLYGLLISFSVLLLVFADLLQNLNLSRIFLILLVPIAYLLVQLARADSRRAYSQLSSLCKLIMLLGVLSMMWA